MLCTCVSMYVCVCVGTRFVCLPVFASLFFKNLFVCIVNALYVVCA